MLIFAESNIDALGLATVGNMIFKISEVIPDCEGDIYGIEVLVPVDKEFKSEGQCICKPAFKIDNAVSLMFYNFDDICEVGNQLYGYARNHNMKPITDVYYVLLQHEKNNKSNNIFEAYIGISSNIV